MEKRRHNIGIYVQFASGTSTVGALDQACLNSAAVRTTFACSAQKTSTKVDTFYLEIKAKTIAKPLCCFCRKEDPLIFDVDEREIAKKYIDTPAETPVKTSKSNNRLSRVWSKQDAD